MVARTSETQPYPPKTAAPHKAAATVVRQRSAIAPVGWVKLSRHGHPDRFLISQVIDPAAGLALHNLAFKAPIRKLNIVRVCSFDTGTFGITFVRHLVAPRIIHICLVQQLRSVLAPLSG